MFRVVPIESDDFTHMLTGTPDNDDPLEGSIEKWSTIVFFQLARPGATISDGGWTTCPLCTLYYRYPERCHGCPIHDAGYPLCEDTPYTDYSIDPSLTNAYAELNFLKEVKDENTR